MYRWIAIASLVALTPLAFVYSGGGLHAPRLRASGDGSTDLGQPRPSPLTRDGAAGARAPQDVPPRDRPASSDAVAPPSKATPPAAEDGHWVFIKSASDYEARLRTADALAATLAEKLADTERGAAGQIEAMRRQLTGEQARSAGLDRALEDARRSEHGQAGEGVARASFPVSDEVATLRSSLQAAASKMTDLQTAAAAQADALERRIGDEQARSAGLDRAVHDARDRLARDEGQRSAADAQVAKLTSALASTKLQVADLQRDAATGQDLSKVLADQRVRSTDLANDLSDARASLARAVQKAAVDGERATAAESAAAAAKGNAARLQSEQEALAGRLADLERRAAAQATASQEGAAGQKARIAALDQDAAKMRGSMARAVERASAADAEAAALRDDRRGSSDRRTSMEGAFDRRIRELQARLDAERTRSAGLDTDLAAERARAARSEQAQASAEAGRRSSEAGAKDAAAASKGALQALRDAAAEAERKATAQNRASTAQAAAAEARATALDRHMAELRDRSGATEQARGADDAARLQQTTAARRDAARTAIAREQARSAGLGRDLADAHSAIGKAVERRAAADGRAGADRDGAVPVAGPRRRLEASQDRGDHPVPDGAPRSTVASVATDGSVPDAGSAVSTDLPGAAEARVSLRYARDSTAARERAVALREALRARGIDASDPVPVTASIESDSVLYYYVEDKGSAERIANGLVRHGPVRRKVERRTSPPPKPGTIEVSVAG